MDHKNPDKNEAGRIGLGGRFSNFVFGAFLIAITMISDGYLGWMAILPIYAVYPITVTITGYSPLRMLNVLMFSKLRILLAGRTRNTNSPSSTRGLPAT